LYVFLRGLMRAITRTVLAGGLLRVTGRENVPRTGALLVCSNHISTVDPPLVPAELPRADTWSMAKSDYFERNRPVTRWLFTRYHAFPVVRHSADRAALKRALSILEQEHVLIVYPEGTRVDDARLREPEPGVGFIALKADAPVLPVALTGTNDCFPKGAFIPRRKTVEVRFGVPFRIAQTHADGSRVTREEAADAIMCVIAQMLPAANRGVFSDVETRLAKLRDVYVPVSSQPASPSPLR
jgi:1-acyl-sn-glycerol-3-phosphate acyltransferase